MLNCYGWFDLFKHFTIFMCWVIGWKLIAEEMLHLFGSCTWFARCWSHWLQTRVAEKRHWGRTLTSSIWWQLTLSTRHPSSGVICWATMVSGTSFNSLMVFCFLLFVCKYTKFCQSYILCYFLSFVLNKLLSCSLLLCYCLIVICAE